MFAGVVHLDAVKHYMATRRLLELSPRVEILPELGEEGTHLSLQAWLDRQASFS